MHLNFEFLRQNSKFKCMHENFLNNQLYLDVSSPFSPTEIIRATMEENLFLIFAPIVQWSGGHQDMSWEGMEKHCLAMFDH